MTVDRGDADDESELLKHEVGEISAQCAEGEETAGKSADRARGSASNRRSSDQRPRVVDRLEVGSARSQSHDFTADLFGVDLFEESTKDLFQQRVRTFLDLKDLSHVSRSICSRSSTPFSSRS